MHICTMLNLFSAHFFNSLPNNKILDMTKLKAFTDDKINVAQIMISVFDWVENTVGKGVKCWILAFSSFPTMFAKGFFLRVGKNWDCVVKS